MTDRIDTKQAKLLAVKVQCPNGHLIYESQPEFWTNTNFDGDSGDITVAATCDACSLDERYFTLVVQSW